MSEIKRLLAKLQSEPDDIDVYFDLADAYAKAGNYQEAKSTMTRLLQKTLSLEDWSNARRWLGFIYYNEKDFDTAIKIAQELVATDLDNDQTGQAYYLMGMCFMNEYHYTEQVGLGKKYLVKAIQSFEQASELTQTEDKVHAEIFYDWGIALRLDDQVDAAIKALKSALEMVSGESLMAGQCHAQLGAVYLERTQEIERVAYHLEIAAKIVRDDDSNYDLTWIYTPLSQACTQLQQYDKALINAQLALETISRDAKDWKFSIAKAHQACGDAYYYGGLDLSLTKKHYQKCLGLLDDQYLITRAQTLFKLAGVEMLEGKYKRASENFKKVLALDASGIDYGALYSAIGECASRSGDSKEAVKAFKSAIEHTDDETEAMVNLYSSLGTNLLVMKRYKEAAGAYRERLGRVDPKAPERTTMMKGLILANKLKNH